MSKALVLFMCGVFLTSMGLYAYEKKSLPESNVYRNNLKNWFLTASGLSQNSHSHSGLAFRQWSLAPHVNSENPSCQNLDSSSCFGIESHLTATIDATVLL